MSYFCFCIRLICILVSFLIQALAWPQAGNAAARGSGSDQSGAYIFAASVSLRNTTTDAAVKTTICRTSMRAVATRGCPLAFGFLSL